MNKFSVMDSECACGQKHFDINVEKIVIESGALNGVVEFLREKALSHILLVVDENTYKAAGQALCNLLSDSIYNLNICLLEPDDVNDVVANESSIVQLLLAAPQNVDVLLAVGSGTIHDITRIVSFKMSKPFISVPTAPSVDGFSSMGAPLVIRGVKTTYQTQAPIAVFADLEVLVKAPKKMIAAGFGDMLGKYTSLADWRFSSLIGGEAFCQLSFDVTKGALDTCVNNLELIAAGESEGIKVLMEALINSGFAMLLIGQSFPASGAEHHVSHYWEMEFIRRKKPQVLHGAKVAMSCQLVADFYKNTVRESVVRGRSINSKNEILKKVQGNLDTVLEIIDSIPESGVLKEMVIRLGGETLPAELGITDALIKKSLNEAHYIRDRFTLLRFYNEYI
jgi:glycerol-1-phosphate dehydrogenase [NAD(P)+]